MPKSPYPMDHKVLRPKPYTRWESTDISETFRRERARLKAESNKTVEAKKANKIIPK